MIEASFLRFAGEPGDEDQRTRKKRRRRDTAMKHNCRVQDKGAGQAGVQVYLIRKWLKTDHQPTDPNHDNRGLSRTGRSLKAGRGVYEGFGDEEEDMT